MVAGKDDGSNTRVCCFFNNFPHSAPYWVFEDKEAQKHLPFRDSHDSASLAREMVCFFVNRFFLGGLCSNTLREHFRRPHHEPSVTCVMMRPGNADAAPLIFGVKGLVFKNFQVVADVGKKELVFFRGLFYGFFKRPFRRNMLFDVECQDGKR